MKRLFRVFLALLVLFSTVPAHGAVSISGTPSSGATSGTDVLTFSHDNDGDFLVVCGGNLHSPGVVTSITYNSVAMTEVTHPESEGALITCYYQIAPSIGTFDVVMTIAENGIDLVAGAISFSGVHQTVPLGTADSIGNGNTPASINVTVSPGGMAGRARRIRESGRSLPIWPGQTA